MASTNAERQRRYRAHKRGDHSFCDPQRCRPDTGAVTAGVTPSVTRDAVTPAAPDLGRRGSQLWQTVTAAAVDDGAALRPGELVLLEEACRTADRLDRLDRILHGDQTEWMHFRSNETGDRVFVVVNTVLSEARQQQVTLKQLLAELRQSGASKASGRTGGAPRPASGGSEMGGEGASGVADLTARIAARRASAPG